MKITFVGCPGSGKTSLAMQVFLSLRTSGRKAELIHEWVRNDIQANGPMTSIWEQYRTRQFQKELEEAIPSAIDYVIVDGGLLLQYFYAVLYADPNEARQRLVLQDIYKYLLDDLYLRRYDMIFYLPLQSMHLDDGTRFQNDAEVRDLDDHMRMVFTRLHRLSNVYTVNAEFDLRLGEVMEKILGENRLTLVPQYDTLNVSIQNY
jgi:nicotinamide riboside kinase